MNLPADWNDLILTAIVPVYNEENELSQNRMRIRLSLSSPFFIVA